MKGAFVLVIAFVFLLPSLGEAQQRLPRNQTLYISGHQFGAPAGWNRLAGVTSWPCNSPDHVLLYETLFTLNIITNELDSLIGQSYRWIDDLTLEVKIRENVHWQDGRPLTTEDVIYTYELAKRYPEISHSSLWNFLERIYRVDNGSIHFEMKKENPNRFMVLDNLRTVSILPKHIWEGIEEDSGHDIGRIREFRNEKPVGSGPYKLYYYSSDRIVLERDDSYWGVELFGGLPKPKYIVHPIYKSNDLGNLAFERGEIDISQQFIQQVWKMWEEKGLSVGTWYKKEPYYVPGSIPAIVFNFERPPLNMAEVRRAIAYSIDYTKIADLAMSSYSIPAKSSLIIPMGSEADFFNENIAKQYGWEHDPAKAIAILEGIGCRRGSDGIYRLPDGTRLGPFKLECPYGWLDWNSALQIVAQSARSVGIDLQTYFPDISVYTDDYLSANFDILMAMPADYPGPTQPWSRFHFVMYSKDTPPAGKLSFRNFGRYRNPEVDRIIEEIPRASDARMRELYDEIEKIFLRDIPAIPLMYRPWQFYEYNEAHWTNFPDENNPYAPPLPLIGSGIKILYHIEPVS